MKLLKQFIQAKKLYAKLTPEQELDFKEAIKKVHPFVIISDKEEQPVKVNAKLSRKEIQEYSEDIDLPFSVCSFEDTKYVKCFYYRKTPCEPLIKYGMSCAVIKETSPKKYRIFFTDLRTEALYPPTFHVADSDGDKHFYEAALTCVKSGFLDKLGRCNIGKSSIKEKIKYGSKSEKKTRVIREIVYITPKKEDPPVSVHGNTISWDYSHRWEVRGHWRVCKGIGKDRQGDYCVTGFTWVKPHEKGPEDKPLIKKTRIKK